MYVCPICNAEFNVEAHAAKHLLECWKRENPFHKSKEAPRSEDIESRQVSNEVDSFFTMLCKR